MAQPGTGVVHIQPKSDVTSRLCYHQLLSWEIREEDWNNMDLMLDIKHPIPGSYRGTLVAEKGGYISVYNGFLGFNSHWPKEVDLDELIVEVVVSLKNSDGENQVVLKCDNTFVFDEKPMYNCLGVGFLAKLNTENIYNVNGSFTLQADILVKLKEQEKVDIKDLKDFVRDVSSIFHDEKNSDVLVRVDGQEFGCHKNVLSARSAVFKNMLAHNTLETKTSIIDIKGITAEATEDMLKFIYTGTLPEDPISQNIDLLHAADMYQIEALKEACVKSLVDSLDVSSCISTLIMVDRFIPHYDRVKEEVIKFIKCKAVELVDMEDWDKLMLNFPALEKEVVKAIVKESREKHVCKFCLVSYPLD